MRKHRFAAGLIFMFVLLGSARSTEAAFFRLCLELDTPGVRRHDLYLNFNVQGNAILVSGMRGIAVIDNHGPVVGSLSRLSTQTNIWQMGLTITYGNMGDYDGPSVEHMVFKFHPGGAISYRLSEGGSSSFVQGTAFTFTCPAT